MAVANSGQMLVNDLVTIIFLIGFLTPAHFLAHFAGQGASEQHPEFTQVYGKLSPWMLFPRLPVHLCLPTGKFAGQGIEK
jgi:hypothetical protein